MGTLPAGLLAWQKAHPRTGGAKKMKSSNKKMPVTPAQAKLVASRFGAKKPMPVEAETPAEDMAEGGKEE